MRIVYCIDSINYLGGAQRVTVTKANALSEIPGNEVWIVVADNSGKNYFKLSPSVHFVDLAINYYEDDWKSILHVLKGILFKRPKHRKKLLTVLEEVKPDIVISVGTSEKFFINRFKRGWACIREVHSIRNYRRLHARSFVQRTIAWMGDLLDFKFAIRRYDRVAVLTKGDLDMNWLGYKNAICIPNPVIPLASEASSLSNERIVTAGRLVPIKGFSSLIHSFTTVISRFPEWQLDIWGEGPCRYSLEEEIDRCGLSGCVHMRGPSNDIQKEMVLDSIFVCTSQFEGFGLSIVEAMSCGLPVVSYDCDFGPGEIIEDGKDGFLVPAGDEYTLAERICSLIEDEGLRKRMGLAALEKSKKYSIDNIIRVWMELFEELCHDKGIGRR